MLLKHLISKMATVMLVALLAVSATAQNSTLDGLLAKYPAQSGTEQAALSDALLAMGAEGIAAVCARLVPADGAADLAERYALSGAAKHVTRPGAESQRVVFAQAVAVALSQQEAAEVRAFLLEILFQAGGDEVVPTVTAFLDDPQVAPHAAQALTAIATPLALAALQGEGSTGAAPSEEATHSFYDGLKALALENPRAALDQSLEAMTSPDPVIRAAALAVAEDLDARGVSRRFARAMRNAPDAVQAEIWRMLVRRGEGRLPSIGNIQDSEGFRPLFNGRNLHGWQGDTKGYSAKNGVLTWEKDGGNIYTQDAFADFVLRFEFQLTPGANNGLGVRVPLEGQASYDGVELQILDNTADQYKDLQPWQYHGSVYGVIAAERGHLRPVGEWNEQVVIVQGSRYTVILNGHTIVDGDVLEASKDGTADGKEHPGIHRTEGHLALLGHGSVVSFRNLWVKNL